MVFGYSFFSGKSKVPLGIKDEMWSAMKFDQMCGYALLHTERTCRKGKNNQV